VAVSTVFIVLLMMGASTPETCWVILQENKIFTTHCCIKLVILIYTYDARNHEHKIHLFEGKQGVCYVGIKVFRGVIRYQLSCSSICFCVQLVKMYSIRCASNSFVLFIHSAKHLTYRYCSVNHLLFISNSAYPS
jgi:hypothetical protein